MPMQGWIEGLRKWIDGEDDLDEKGEPVARSKWDDFLVAIAREVEQTMQREMFTPPGGPTYVPREYIVFLSTDDNAEWQGEKREGLERGLHHVLSERARELAGENEFQTKTLTVELRVDPALEKGRYRVQHVWDSETQKTMVKPRKRAEPVNVAPTLAGEQSDEATIVRPRRPGVPVFSVDVRRVATEGEISSSDTRSFYKDEISIGRGSSRLSVDLKLEGDLEVSRHHATLKKNGDGEYLITCKGANPIVLNGEREVAANESGNVKPGDRIGICSFELVIV